MKGILKETGCFLFLLACLLFSSINQQSPAQQSQLDPRRKPPRINRPEDSEPGKVSSDETPECDKSQPIFRTCKIVLPNFALGAYYHPRVRWFAREVAERIKSYEKQSGGISIGRVTVQGFADGFPNHGIDGWGKIQGNCGEGRKGLLNDEDLARVRGCIVKQAILKELGDSLIILNRPPEEVPPHDYPDGQNKGGAYRKVEITFKIMGE